MNRILNTLLIGCLFSLSAEARRITGGSSKESTSESSMSSGGTVVTTEPVAAPSTPSRTFRTTSSTRTASTPFDTPAPSRTASPSTRTASTPFTTPASSRTVTPSASSVSTPFTTPAPSRTVTPSAPAASTPFTTPAPSRTYTPSTPAYRGESFRGASEERQPQQQPERQATRFVRQSTPSSTIQQTTPAPAEAQTPSASVAPARREEGHRTSTPTREPQPEAIRTENDAAPRGRNITVISSREPKNSTLEPPRTDTSTRAGNITVLSSRERKDTTREGTSSEPTQPGRGPNISIKRNRTDSPTAPAPRTELISEPTPQRTVERPQRERPTRVEQPQSVQITPPSRTSSRTTERESPSATRNPVERAAAYSRHERPSRELNTYRRPEQPRPTYHHPPDTHNYHSYHYQPHYYPQRPVTCYSGRDAFWAAFSFTLAAPFVAPLYVAHVADPFPVRTVTTTWHSGNVAVSVSSHSTYPVYTYRPYYCSSSWYHHDGWQHSYAYYGGWKCNWYGGFSYMFNPTPVYRTYYLYEEPQTIVVQQPAQQVVIYNQPPQPAVQNQDFLATTAPSTPQTPPPVQVAAGEDPAATTNEPERCFCACKCNRRVPCICEYACGSEFNYTPDAYTLGGFVSYAESLNAELIWSSYAELDRPEATDYVAETWE
jgi:hypothetical protein